MNKQRRIRELDELIAKAQAEREQLAKEQEFWVPSDVPYAIHGDGCIGEGSYSGYAKFGHAAPDREKAEQLRDFFAELVPKHPVPEVGQDYWTLSGPQMTITKYRWENCNYDLISYNAGQTWDHKPTDEEVERKRAVLSFDSLWRWV